MPVAPTVSRATAAIDARIAQARAAERTALRDRVQLMPQLPGVYRWFDEKGYLLYIGKARNLRKRLQTYVRSSSGKENFRLRGLRERMADVEITVTDTELNALILEMHLIRTLKPKYNVALTRDAHFVFVRISTHEDFPGVTLTPYRLNDGATYFGPFSNVYAQQKMLLILRKLYPFRTCSMSLSVGTQTGMFDENAPMTLPLDIVAVRRDRRLPCLDYHIKRCIGPCTGDVMPSEYRQRCIDGVLAFYGGDIRMIMNLLVQQMKDAPDSRKLERAKDIADALHYIGQIERQKAFFEPTGIDADVLGTSTSGRWLQIVLLAVRGGKIVHEYGHRLLQGTGSTDEHMTQFLVQHYAFTGKPPAALVTPATYTEKSLMRGWFKHDMKETVSVTGPADAAKRRMHALAVTNAKEKLRVREG